MVTMTSFEVAILEHRQRAGRAERIGWLRQAAAESATAQRRPRPERPTGATGLAALVAGLLAAFFR